jgi:hypothetical protein
MAAYETIQINELSNPLVSTGGLGSSMLTTSQQLNTIQSNLDNDGVAAQSLVLSNIFVFNILVNKTGFSTFVNNERTSNNKVVRISRESLLLGPIRIDITKNGFVTDEYYIIELEDDNSAVILNSKFPQPLGLTTKNVILEKYIGDVVEFTKSITGDVSVDLNFKLNKIPSTGLRKDLSLYNITFNISGELNSVSVLKNSTKSAEFFPLVGSTVYQDVEDTTYLIRSSDTSLYRISSITFSGLTAPTNLVAKDGESLELNINLNSDYVVSITTEVVSVGVSTIEPVVELVNINAREYNINSKAGVPLIFTKSENVTVITVIVGDDVLEFDNLDSGDLCGIIIPHNVFKNIGKYNIKIFPFSLDDYENEARPKLPRLRVGPKSAEIRFNSVETLSINTPTSTDKFNPYNLNLNTTSNGVGATTITNNRFNNTNLGSVGSLLNVNLDNTNIR